MKNIGFCFRRRITSSTALWPMMKWVAAVACLLSAPLSGQWHKYPTQGVPRLANGKADLNAPVPRKPNGQPDLKGIWLVPGLKYLINIAADLKDVPQAEAAAWVAVARMLLNLDETITKE
jgi:hypothetical protein